MQEIEYKFAIGDFDEITRKLEESHAEPLGYVEQTDRFFDWPDGRIRENDSCFRIRTERAMDSGEIQVRLTFKGPRQEAAAKIRSEFETAVGDFDKMRAILEALGLIQSMVIQKRRKSYRFAGCRVELDELPHIGKFVEIEGPSLEAIDDIKRQLAPEAEHISKSYSRLLRELCDENNLSRDEVVF